MWQDGLTVQVAAGSTERSRQNFVTPCVGTVSVYNKTYHQAFQISTVDAGFTQS